MPEEDTTNASDDAQNSDTKSRDGSEGSEDRQQAATYTPPASQEDLDRIINKAVGRAHAKYADYEQLKADAARARALDDELASEADKAARTAREEERSKVVSEFSPRLVRSAFRGEAKGVWSKDQLDDFLEDRDLSKYLTDNGDVDEDKVAATVAKFAPKKDEREFPDLGAGNRGGAPVRKSMNDLIRQQAGRTG